MTPHRFPAVILFGAFAAGILLCHFANLPPAALFSIIAAAVAACLTTLHFSKLSDWQLPALVFLFVSLGATTEALNRPFGHEDIAPEKALQGEVREIVHNATADKVSLLITGVVDGEGNIKAAHFPLTLIAGNFPARTGSTILLRTPSGITSAAAPGDELTTVLECPSDLVILSSPSSPSWRERVEEKIFSSSLSTSAKSLVSALTTGDRNAVSGHQREAYSRAGIVHILAISGLHIGIIGMLLYVIFLPLVFVRRQLPLLLTIAGIWGFVAFTGASVSAVRAAVMFTVGGLAVLMQRQNNPVNTLAVAALLITAFNPSDLFSVGFQLSFAAVLIIIISSSLPDHFISRHRRPKTYRLLSLLTASLAAQLATLPLLAYYFHTVPLLSLPLNILVIAVVPAIVWCSVAYVALLCCGIDLRPLCHILDFMAGSLDRSASLMASAPLSLEGIWLPAIGVVATIAAVIALALAARTPRNSGRWTFAAVMTLAATAPVVLLPEATPEDSVEIFPAGGEIVMRQMSDGVESYDLFPPETPTEALILGKSVVFVNHKPQTDPPQKRRECDVLILGSAFRTAVDELLEHYNPSMIALAGSRQTMRTDRLSAACDSLAVPRLLITREHPLRITSEKAALSNSSSVSDGTNY